MSTTDTLDRTTAAPRDRSHGRPLIMGIVNVTPDSFSDGGAFLDASAAIQHGRRLLAEGADLLDIGGESTRPGSEPVSPVEQWRRIGPVIEALVAEAPLVSVDTRSSEVARHALDLGVRVINDVTAGQDDAEMFGLVAERAADIILMHMQGEPGNMQANPSYSDCTGEIRACLLERAAAAERAGIASDRIWIDPGIGFGKSVDHNLELLRRLDGFVESGYRVLLGASRKSFIHRLYGAPVDQRLGGSLAALVPAFRAGVHAVRVHDVRQTFQFLELLSRLE